MRRRRCNKTQSVTTIFEEGACVCRDTSSGFVRFYLLVCLISQQMEFEPAAAPRQPGASKVAEVRKKGGKMTMFPC